MASNPSDRPEAASPYPAPDQASPLGEDDPAATQLDAVTTPDIRGTIVFTALLLMGIFGFWALMYLDLLGR